jgi:hypothetical protein
MELIYQPNWYELDQPLLVDYPSYYYLTKDKKYFLNGIVSDNDVEIRGEIKSITHDSLGNILAFIPFGPSYKMIKSDASILSIDAEDNHGEIENHQNEYIDWSFKVHMDVLEETDFTSKKRFFSLSKTERDGKKEHYLLTLNNRYKANIRWN